MNIEWDAVDDHGNLLQHQLQELYDKPIQMIPISDSRYLG